MVRRPNLKLTGVFLIVSVFVLFVILAFLLKNKIFADKTREVVMYFEESINGLNVGAPVVLKGVKIGEVNKIEVIANPETLDFSIPVYAHIRTQDVIGSDYRSGREVLKILVERGLRARLVSQSYVTGQLMIELEMFPDTPIKYHENAKVAEVPTTLSQFGELSRSLQNLPLAEGIKNFTEFFKSLNNNMPQVADIVENIDAVINKNKEISGEILDNFNKATINVAKVAKSMQNLTDYLERHPEALIKGKR